MKKRTKKICSTILVAALTFTCLFSGKSHPVQAAADGFYISGTTLYDGNGNPFVMRGINMAHNWFQGNTAESIAAIAATGANTVRVVLSNGEVWSKDSLETINNIIRQCKEQNLVAVLEVHDATGRDDIASLNKAVDYWIEMKSALIGNEKYVIVNIANEWAGEWDSRNWRDGYLTAIPKLRNAGIKNTLMVDCAGWGQYPQSIVDYGTDVLNADVLKNTMFSIHMYEYAGGSEATVKNNIDGVLNQGLSLVIGEFAAYHTNGNVEEQMIMDYCQQKGAGYLGWSWKGNNEDLSYLDISHSFSGGSYTPWGETLINGRNGIRETSQLCSVYGGGSNGHYIQYFYGSSYAEPYTSAVSLFTDRNGGVLRIADIKANGYFYAEYTGTYDSIELNLQSWSGGPEWVKVNPSESGTTAEGYHYAKFNYNDIISAYGGLNMLDQVHVGAAWDAITVMKVQYATY